MAYSLKVATPTDWVDVALSDFDAFLLDHAACERKASAVGMSFVVKYPDRTALMEPMIQFAREELEHFHQVYKIILSRGLLLYPDSKDDYVNLIQKHARYGRDERFLDRLLCASVIEARGCERMGLVANKLQDESLKRFYTRLTHAEEKHRDIFVELAELYFPNNVIQTRLEEFLDIEAAAIQSIPFRSALH